MSKKFKACVCGHFANGKQLLNGQTVKTKILTEELENVFGKDNIYRVDTHGGIKALLKMPFALFGALKKCENIVILPAHNGLRVIAPILAFYNKFFKRRLHYDVIGGWLPDFIRDKKSLKASLKKFTGIYVETNTMKAALKDQGFENVFVMPNCKNLDILTPEELVYHTEEPYPLCTFSRVMREKGIGDAVEAVRSVNEKLGRTAYTLDIYGQVDSDQIEWFEALKNTFPDYIRYMGVVPYDQSVSTLKNYFALLFPTYYDGEGFAGTLIDAFAAGVPVIASDWKYNSEIVNQNVGNIYPTGCIDELTLILSRVIDDYKVLLSKKEFCLREAEKYKIEKVTQVLIEQIEND